MASSKNKALSRAILAPWLAASLVFLLGALLSAHLGRLDAARRASEARSLAINDLAAIRARLEGHISTVFSATSAIAGVIAHQGSISQDLFAALAEQAIQGHPQIRNIGVAPDNTMAMIFPLEGNRQAIGFRYESVPEQFEAVRQAMQSRRPVFSGPHQLVQGGRGLIARVPVFTDKGAPAGSASRYWGIVSVVTHIDVLLDAAGVHSTQTLDIGLRKMGGQGRSGVVIHGEERLFALDPVAMTVVVPGAEWQIVAVRRGGWPATTAAGSPLFYVGLGNGLLAAAFVGWLMARPARVRRQNEELQREIADRIRMEEELRRSEQKYASFFHLAPDMVGITRLADGCFLEANPGVTSIAGWQPHELLGRTSVELGLWNDETRAEAVAITQRQGWLENFEFTMGTRSGEQRYGLMFLRPITIGGEQCLYFMVRDITELKLAQRVLEREQARLRNLLQTVPAMIWMKDPEGVYLSCNSRFERFIGASEAEIIGRTDYDFFDRDLAEFFREHDRLAVIAGGPSVNEEWITYADDGHLELLETVKTPVHDAAGILVGVMGMGWNITEKKRIEEELRNERSRFVNLVDSVDGIVWEMDARTFTCTYVSGQAERLLGYPAEAWREPGFWLSRLHPEDRERIETAARAHTALGEDHELEYRFLARDGRVFWIQDIVAVVSEQGLPRWRRGIMVDTTGRKQDEEDRRRLESQLRQAQKMEAVGRLAGGVAHDFNNQLSVILGYADLMQQGGADPARIGGYLDQIIRAATGAQDITRQLLAFSRQEAVAPRELDLNAQVKAMRKGLGRLVREDIRFEVNLAGDLWPIRMDPTQVDQVIMNLIVNARDAMEAGGVLRLATDNVRLDASFARQHPEIEAGEYVRLTVRDTGCGMGPETLQRLFEPFYTTKETGKGTGLGLATVYGIVTGNRGLVLVESESGAGSTFSVYLPRCSEGEPDAVDEAEASTPRTGRPATILLVEDEETVREMACDILSQSGYDILPAASPREAIELCRQTGRPIDMLLTDVIMPEMNGRELSRQIEALRPGIRVLYMSGYAADILPQERDGEDVPLLRKPFSVQSLLTQIEQQLRRGEPWRDQGSPEGSGR